MGGAPFTFPLFFDNRTSQCTHTAPSDQEPPGDNPQQAGGTRLGCERQGASSTSVQPQNHAMGVLVASGDRQAPTEAAAVSVVYGLFVGMVIYKEVKFSDCMPHKRLPQSKFSAVHQVWQNFL